MRNSSAAVATIIIGLISAPAMRAQTTETQPRFDATDAHVTPPAANGAYIVSGGVLRGGRYDLRKATMLDLIKTAWNVDPDIVLGGPNWLELDRFDISAKAPPQTSPETIRLMLQALLKDRFGLVVHKDTRPMPAFELTVGKSKPKLTESNGSGPFGCRYQQPPSMGTFVVYACRNVTMDELVQNLNQVTADYLTVPVVNGTGLEGAWDFDLKWDPRFQVPRPDASRTTIFAAVDQELGLKLVPKTAPEPVLVVDRVNEKPTSDLPGIEKLLPPRTVEFEVADLKLSRPGETANVRVTSGLFEARATTLAGLISYGFNIQHVDELVADLPKWAENLDLDINGKLPAETLGEKYSLFADDDLRMMVRNLLIERFGIRFHYEDRPVSAYTLVSAKPKIKKADPSRRSICKNARVVENDPRESNPRLNRLVTCQNVTMTQFADLLQGFSPNYFRAPIENATGIDGAWDFTLSFSSAASLTGPPAGDGALPSDPNGALSLPDAISKQLGLKLEKHQRPAPVLVIDHIEEKPTEN